MPVQFYAGMVSKQMDIKCFAPEIEVIDALDNLHLDMKVQTMRRLEGVALEALYTFL